MTEAEEEGEGIGGGDHYEESGCRAWMALALYIAQSTIRLGRRLQNTDEMMGRGGRIVSISLMMRRGGRTVSISRGGEGDITSLVDVNQACLLFLEDTNRAPRV